MWPTFPERVRKGFREMIWKPDLQGSVVCQAEKAYFLEFNVDKSLPSCIEKSLKSVSGNYLACVST